jgi:hypothetical protein
MLCKITHGRNLPSPLTLGGPAFNGLRLDADGTYSATPEQVAELQKRGYTVSPIRNPQRSTKSARIGEPTIPLDVYYRGKR